MSGLTNPIKFPALGLINILYIHDAFFLSGDNICNEPYNGDHP